MEYDFSYYYPEDESYRRAAGRSKFEDSRPGCRVVALSIGARRLVFGALVEGIKGTITARIAVQMTLDAMLRRVEALVVPGSAAAPAVSASDVVQAAFREANQDVYRYAHRMLAGGRIAATALGFAFDGDRFSIGRVGPYACLLWRNGVLVDFFANGAKANAGQPGALERFIGANAQILVDVASLAVKDRDFILMSAMPPEVEYVRAAERLMPEVATAKEAATQLGAEALRLSLVEREGLLAAERNAVVIALQFGPPTIVLRNVVFEEFS